MSRLSWHGVMLCLVIATDQPLLWLLLIFVFPPHLTVLIRTSFKGQYPSSTPYSLGLATPRLPLHLGNPLAAGAGVKQQIIFKCDFIL